MKEKEIIEGNVLIAKFMGAVPQQWYPESKVYNQTGIHYQYPTDSPYPDNKRYHSDQLLKYHKDWKWLMNVIKKIGSLTGSWEFESKERDKFEEIFDIDCTMSNFLEADIDSIYKRVVEFIEYYNQLDEDEDEDEIED